MRWGAVHRRARYNLLTQCVKRGWSACIRFLLQTGGWFSVNVLDGAMGAPLHALALCAEQDKYEPCCVALMDCGADLTTRMLVSRDTPLHCAVRERKQAAYPPSRLVEVLLRHGANPNLRNAEGDTPLTLAEAVGNEAAADLLRPLTTARSLLKLSSLPCSARTSYEGIRNTASDMRMARQFYRRRFLRFQLRMQPDHPGCVLELEQRRVLVGDHALHLAAFPSHLSQTATPSVFLVHASRCLYVIGMREGRAPRVLDRISVPGYCALSSDQTDLLVLENETTVCRYPLPRYPPAALTFTRSPGWFLYLPARLQAAVRLLMRGACYLSATGRPLCPQSPLHLLPNDVVDEIVSRLQESDFEQET